jgi:hypothetical protein
MDESDRRRWCRSPRAWQRDLRCFRDPLRHCGWFERGTTGWQHDARPWASVDGPQWTA